VTQAALRQCMADAQPRPASADHDGVKIKIEKEVGTTGHIGDEKIDTGKTKRTTEIEGDVGFAYVSVESIKRIAKDCR